MAQIKDGSSFLDGKKIPKSVNGKYADDNGDIKIETFSSSADIANNPVTFTEASERINIQSKETAETLFGKIKKWFSDLKALAFKDKISSSDLDSALSSTINNKVDKENGKGLSTNDFTNEAKIKLDGVTAGAEANVQSDWNESVDTSDAYIKNKPTKLSQFTNDAGFMTSIPEDYVTDSELDSKGYLTAESDPNVPSWAKSPTKPSYQAIEITVSSIPGLSSSNVQNILTEINTNISNIGDTLGSLGKFNQGAELIEDWNLAINNGIYMGNSASNSPDTNWFIGIVMKHNEAYTTQLVQAFSSSKKWYFRNQMNGVWDNWIEMNFSNIDFTIEDLE